MATSQAGELFGRYGSGRTESMSRDTRIEIEWGCSSHGASFRTLPYRAVAERAHQARGGRLKRREDK